MCRVFEIVFLEIKINLKPLHNDKNNEVKYMYNIVTLDKEKIEELKLEKR